MSICIANLTFQDSEITSHSAIDGLTYNGAANPAFGAPGPVFFTATEQLNAVEDVSGNPLPNAPDTTFKLSLNYDVTGNFTAQLGASYQSETNFREFGRSEDAQKGFTLFNANLTWTSDDEASIVRVFGNNLTDEEYFLFLAASQLTDNRLGSIGAPRQVGAEVTFNFKTILGDFAEAEVATLRLFYVHRTLPGKAARIFRKN